jgi:hypothetical protein
MENAAIWKRHQCEVVTSYWRFGRNPKIVKQINSVLVIDRGII